MHTVYLTHFVLLVVGFVVSVVRSICLAELYAQLSLDSSR